MSTITGNSNTQQYKTPTKRTKAEQSMLGFTNDTKNEQTNISQRLYEQMHNSQLIAASQLSQIIRPSNQFLRVKLRAFRIAEKILRQSFEKIYMFSKKYSEGRKRMIYGIGRVFRTAEHQHKYHAFQNLKKLTIAQRNQKLKQTQKEFSDIYQTGCRLFVTFCKNRHQRAQQQAIFRIKMLASTNRAQRKSKISKFYKIVMNSRRRCLEDGLKMMKTCRYNYLRKIKALQIMNILKDNRITNLRKGFTNMKRNVLSFRQVQIKNDKGVIQRKIMTQSQEEVQQNHEKVRSLQAQLQEIIRQKQQMNKQFSQQKQIIIERSNSLKAQIDSIARQNEQIIVKTERIVQQIHEPYSMNEISSFLYNNLLVFLYENPNVPLSKMEIIKALETPLLPINVNISLIKQENQVMKSLLSEYIVIFGARSLKLEGIDVEKPYEYLQKQNNILHNILLTLIGRLNMTKDDIGHIREGIQSMGETVRQLDKFQNNLREKKILLKDQFK